MNLIAQLAATNPELAKEFEQAVPKKGGSRIKVSEKGAVSVYGLQRFPVTLYGNTWLKLLGMAEEIKAFIEANNDKLAHKEQA